MSDAEEIIKRLAYAMMSARPNSHESARQRMTGGDMMFDSDAYISPFAPRSDRDGPVGLTGDPAIASGGGSVFSPMLPPPARPQFDVPLPSGSDANQITPQMQSEMYRALINSLLSRGI